MVVAGGKYRTLGTNGTTTATDRGLTGVVIDIYTEILANLRTGQDLVDDI
jgi:hypothetical protein